ncbi:MAG TPA: hypothetical protein PL100_02095 [Bacillota bacterium]|nr:hypothetical protein [Bacillota bacterium]HQC48305.1 hypothetical protein [Bacillota bacterium]
MKHRSNIIQRGGAFQRLLIKKHSIILWLIPIVFLSMTTIVSLIGGLALTEFPGFSYGFVLFLMSFVVNHQYFSFMHRTPSADFMYALPMSRAGLYLRLNTSAIINLLAPSSIMAVIRYVVIFFRTASKYGYDMTAQDFTAYWTSYASLTIKILLFFFIMQIFYFISDKTSSAITMFVLVNIFWPLVVLLFTDATANFLPGYIAPSLLSSGGVSTWVLRIIQLFSPASAFFLSYLPAFDWFSLALLILFAMVSWYLFRKRQAEHAHSSGTLRSPVMVTHWVVTLGISLLGGYSCHYLRHGVASFLTAGVTSVYSPVPFIIGVVLGLVLSLWVFNLFQGKGKINWRALIAPAVAAVVPLTVWLVIVITGAFGFSVKTPQASDVAKVTIAYHNVQYGSYDVDKVTTHVSLTDERDIDDFMKLYCQTVSPDHPGLSVPRNLSSAVQLRTFIEEQRISIGEKRYRSYYEDAEFTITMKDGSTMKRRLPLLESPANEHFYRLFMRNHDYRLAVFTFKEIFGLAYPDFVTEEILPNENVPEAQLPSWVSDLQKALNPDHEYYSTIYETYSLRMMIAQHLLTSTEKERAAYIDQAPCVIRLTMNELAIKEATEPLVFDYPVNPDRLKPLGKALEELLNRLP